MGFSAVPVPAQGRHLHKVSSSRCVSAGDEVHGCNVPIIYINAFLGHRRYRGGTESSVISSRSCFVSQQLTLPNWLVGMPTETNRTRTRQLQVLDNISLAAAVVPSAAELLATTGMDDKNSEFDEWLRSRDLRSAVMTPSMGHLKSKNPT